LAGLASALPADEESAREVGHYQKAPAGSYVRVIACRMPEVSYSLGVRSDYGRAHVSFPGGSSTFPGGSDTGLVHTVAAALAKGEMTVQCN
jgi:hypothetical protein